MILLFVCSCECVSTCTFQCPVLHRERPAITVEAANSDDWAFAHLCQLGMHMINRLSVTKEERTDRCDMIQYDMIPCCCILVLHYKKCMFYIHLTVTVVGCQSGGLLQLTCKVSQLTQKMITHTMMFQNLYKLYYP